MTKEQELQMRAESLACKVKHYLITTMGVTIDEANDEELFRAFSLTLREEIMINWTAMIHTMNKQMPRTLYYICLEYLPGRLLGNNIANIHTSELVKMVMKKLGRNLGRIMAIEQDPALGNGGLGRLAACILDSLATQQYPAIGYGLRYQYGIFAQEVWAGSQVERPETWLLHENPWEFRREAHSVNVMYDGQTVAKKNEKGEEIYEIENYEEVRAVCYDIPIIGYRETSDFSVVSLRLWSTKESPRNFQLQRYNAGLLDQAAENTTLTDVLYPNDNNELGKRIRLKQEYLLAAASIGDIVGQFFHNMGEMKEFADKVRIHLNDTHPALAIAELMYLLLRDHHFGWGEAFEVVKTCVNYTNHTILKEALEEWNEERVERLLPRQYHIIQRLNEDFCHKIREAFPGDEEKLRRMSIIEGGQIRMANLSIYGSHRVNGVAALHTEIIKNVLFKDFFDMYPDRFLNVTNGVTQRRWMHLCNPDLSEFITKRIGKGWITDLKEIRQLSQFATDRESQEEFLAIKRRNKKAFAEYLRLSNPFRDEKGHIIGVEDPFNEEALFDVQIKRIHEYKRQLLTALHALILYQELKENPNCRQIQRMVIIGGKAAPGYKIAKDIIRLIHRLSRLTQTDSDVKEKLRVSYYENYNASRAEKVIPAADLSEQVSCAGQEASGTGNMKLTMNGALTIGTEDGANIEMHQEITDQFWPFRFGANIEEIAALRKSGQYNPKEIYEKDKRIRKALDALKEGTIATSEEEKESFTNLYRSLIEPVGGGTPDYYFVLYDLPSYYDTQKRVEELYQKPHEWAKFAIENIACMSRFSIDESIQNYANLVWGLESCPVDEEELKTVRIQFSEHDKCRIF